jgi:hypothetical protein
MTEPAAGRMSANELSRMPRGDRAIDKVAADRMGRAAFARALAEEILSAPTEGGFVIGLCGPWGSGKTSILHMVQEEIGTRALVMQFNPWFFTGTEALITTYFTELGRQLKVGHSKWKSVGKQLGTYGALLAPLAAPIGGQGLVSAGAGMFNNWSSQKSVADQRRILADSLRKAPQQLVVLIDDVDRLRPDEVRDIMRLVRLVGDLPNTTYVLAFDRERVEQWLGDDDPAYGRAYLEKIVQVAYDVPVPREIDVSTMFVNNLETILEDVTVGPFARTRWDDIFVRIIRPLLATPRDAARLLEALPMTLRLIGDEVALEDVLALEALRVLKPDFYTQLIAHAAVLGDTRIPGAYRFNSNDHRTGGPLRELNAVDFDLAEVVCKLLFPAAIRHYENNNYQSEWLSTWRRERVVASPEVLRFYLERQLAPGVVPAHVLDEVIAALPDADRLRKILEPFPPDELVDLLHRLASSVVANQAPDSVELDDDAVFAALPVIADLFVRLPLQRPGFFGEARQVTVGRVVHRLLEHLDPADAARSVRDAMPRMTHPEAQLFLVEWSSHRERPWIDAAAKQALEADLRDRLVGLSVVEFTGAFSMLDLPELLCTTETGRTYLDAALENDDFFVKLLMVARTRVQSAALGSVAVSVDDALQWRRLTALVTAERLRARVGDFFPAGGHGVDDRLTLAQLSALELVLRYTTGWRPEHDPDALYSPRPVEVVPDQEDAGGVEHPQEVPPATP